MSEYFLKKMQKYSNHLKDTDFDLEKFQTLWPEPNNPFEKCDETWKQSYLKHHKPVFEVEREEQILDPVEALKQQLLNEKVLIYHPKRGHIWNRKIKNKGTKAPLLKDEQQPIKLVHYGRASGLKELDPKFQGTGAPSGEYKYGLPEIPRTYYYREGTPEEHIVKQGAKSKYKATLEPHHKLYDLANDHENLVQEALKMNNGAWNSDLILGHIKNSGYHGFFHSKSALPNVVALFHPHPVDSEEVLRA